ncbi:MAG: sulfur carrier protein ThiS [Myxococcales bacterium]|nr:sulfur carrier protein ThiS [Myxococcales bacterium]
MKLCVNGQEATFREALTIAELTVSLGLSGPVAVERNGVVVPRAAHASTLLADGDAIEVVHFVGGG